MKIVIALVALAVLLGSAACFFGGTDIHFHKRPKDGRIRIACIGDSITNGALIPGCWFRSYPTVLGKMLGNRYHVENYGVNGRTVQPDGDQPYIMEREYRRSLWFKPDIAVILIGVNDTKPKNWKTEEEFYSEYVKFIKTYMDKIPEISILLCTVTWSVNAENRIQGLTNDTNADLFSDISELVKRAGAELELPVADIYSAFLNRKDLLSYDNVHPNKRGAKLLAEEVKEVLEEKVL